MVPDTYLSRTCSGAHSTLQRPHSTAHTVSHTALGVPSSAEPHRHAQPPARLRPGRRRGGTPQTPGSALALLSLVASLPCGHTGSPGAGSSPRPGSGPAGKLRRGARWAPLQPRLPTERRSPNAGSTAPAGGAHPDSPQEQTPPAPRLDTGKRPRRGQTTP